jgi:hypothetical protein
VRTALDRGSGSVTSLALIGACVVLALGGLGGATVIFRITEAIRNAELVAASVATRALAGDPTPCEPMPPGTRNCRVHNGVATIQTMTAGVVASAVAGPDD